MSGAKEIGAVVRDLRQAGLTVTRSRHIKVRKPGDTELLVLPKTPGTQSSVRKSMRMAQRLIRGGPAREQADHAGPNGPGKLTREPEPPAAAARPARRLKKRFEPESADIGRLGYSGEELSARMPAPAPPKPRRPFVTPDDPLAYARWLTGKRRPCMACEKDISPGQLTLVHCDMSEPGFLQTCTRQLRMPADKAAALVSVVRLPDHLGRYMLVLCPACLQSSRTTMGGRPLELDTFWTLGDISDLEAARTQRLLTLPEPVSPADQSPWPAEFSFPKPSPVGMTPDVKKIAEQAAAAWSREQKRGRQARRKDSKPAADPATLPTTVTDMHKAVTTMFR